MERLQKNGNYVILDLVDKRITERLAQNADCLIASSVRGYHHYRSSWPHIPSFHVTHHVDLRIGSVAASTDYAVRYFGEPLNTVTSPEIAARVEFVPVDTSTASVGWMAKLDGASMHYAVRATRDIDGHKPFLKGFIAAKCGANMVVQRNAGDAIFYLGEDYPFLIAENASEAEIVSRLDDFAGQFGGPDWSRGLEIMREVARRSSVSTVVSEISFMFSALGME